MENKSQLIIYRTEDGKTKLEVRLEHKSIWLTQAAMAELFQTTTANIGSERSIRAKMGMYIFSKMNTDELDDFFLEGGDELMNSQPCPKCGEPGYL